MKINKNSADLIRTNAVRTDNPFSQQSDGRSIFTNRKRNFFVNLASLAGGHTGTHVILTLRLVCHILQLDGRYLDLATGTQVENKGWHHTVALMVRQRGSKARAGREAAQALFRCRIRVRNFGAAPDAPAPI